jgi:hypothetical protein
MFIQTRLFWSLAIAFVVAASPAQAFRACTSGSPTAPSGHWPDPRNTAHFGTQKWDFDWRVDQEGLEVSNVRYTSDLSQPKKLVIERASLPFLPVHYPPSAPDCQDPNPHGFIDQLNSGDIDTNPFCCYHVPTTLCNLPDRPRKCDPATPQVSSCPASAISCSGVCVGTQVDLTPPLEDGEGEVVSGASNADILLSTTFRLGGYVFVQRWRFQDVGTIRPSLRAGGVHNCSWHNHQIYWRFHFQLADGAAPKSVIQQCDGGGCADMGAAGWSANLPCSCGNRPGGGKSWWRFSDSNVAGRAVILQTNPTEGDPSGFCENAPPYCGARGGCVNGRDFCALGAGEPHETFVTDNCNDHLPDQLAQPACANLQNGADTAFWYFAHINHHDPCTYLPICDPALGTLAFGPTIRLVGNW